MVVVYKVDRLTRSLVDFAKMVELFDAHGVSFVSVTQQFNTTNSMGRLTLNVLLSFAQFEREVTGERIRDKIAASKRKGMWMGGITPIGYIAKDRTLSIDDDQAQRVRAIYRLYLELDCVRLLKEELARRNWVTPPQETRRLNGGGNRPFSRGHLYRILTNPGYVGKIAHKGQAFPGNHPAIVDPELWQAVQDRLTTNRQGQRKRANTKHPSLLAGLLFDGEGTRLTATHTQKNAQRYRYYVSRSAVDGSMPSGNRLRLPAQELEDRVVAAVIGWLRDESQTLEHLTDLDARTVRQRLRQGRELADQLEAAPAEPIRRCIDRIVVLNDQITIAVRLDAIGRPSDANDPTPAVAMIAVPTTVQRCGMAVRLIVHAPSGAYPAIPRCQAGRVAGQGAGLARSIDLGPKLQHRRHR